MPLAIETPLRASDLMEARELKDGKIFLLTGRDGSKLVLKAESNVTGDQLKAAAPVLKAIDPRACSWGQVLPLVIQIHSHAQARSKT